MQLIPVGKGKTSFPQHITVNINHIPAQLLYPSVVVEYKTTAFFFLFFVWMGGCGVRVCVHRLFLHLVLSNCILFLFYFLERDRYGRKKEYKLCGQEDRKHQGRSREGWSMIKIYYVKKMNKINLANLRKRIKSNEVWP